MSQEKSKTIPMRIVGIKEVYYGICASREYVSRTQATAVNSLQTCTILTGYPNLIFYGSRNLSFCSGSSLYWNQGQSFIINDIIIASILL